MFFFICLVPYIHFCLYYFLILCYFHLPFLTLLATRHILQFIMFDSISLKTARNIMEIKNIYYNQNKYCNTMIFGTKYELLLSTYRITFFLAFGLAKICFSHHILMNILIYILFCDKEIS